MTIRADVSLQWYEDPRIAEITSGSNELSVQDSHDTLATIQDKPEGHQFEFLLSSAGKENLGGGTTVGITTTLNNVQYAPKSTDPRETGTTTATDPLGVTLTDTGKDFVAAGVVRGDWVVNFTDQSVTEVLGVTTTTIRTRGLRNGTANTFTSGDAYKVWEVSEFDLAGGNFVAVDDVGGDLNPLFPVFGRFVTKASSSSATLADAKEIRDVKFLIESTRPHHTGHGTVYYWNPDTGDDSLDGLSPTKAFKTFAMAHSTAGDGTHDIIVAISGVSGQTITTETIEITKNYLFLRGPGRDFRFKPTATNVPTISINAVGVEISGVVVDTANSGGQNAIEVQTGADFFFIDHVWSRDAQHACVKVQGAVVYGRIDGCFFSHPVDHAIHIDGDIRHTRITNTEIDAPAGSGIEIEGTTARNNIIGDGVKIYDSATYGIEIVSPATRNFIDADVSLYDNASGNILDNGIDTSIESSTNISAIWSYVVDGTFTAEELMRIIASAAAGKASGLDVLSPVYRDISDSKDRITATTDAFGNRSAVTLDAS